MSDDTNKIAEKLAAMPVKWWTSLHWATTHVLNAEMSHEGFDVARKTAAFEASPFITELLASIGLTVSDDAGVTAKVHKLAAEALIASVNWLWSDESWETIKLLTAPQPAPPSDPGEVTP